jgi:RHS repeat-associated protein
MRGNNLIFSVLTALVLFLGSGLQPIFTQSFQPGGNLVLNPGSQLSRPHLVRSENIRDAHIKRTNLLQNSRLQLRRYRFNLRLVVQFLQTDPMGYQDSMNMYQSFNQNPVNFVDPMGERFLRSQEEVISEYRVYTEIYGLSHKEAMYTLEEIGFTDRNRADNEGWIKWFKITQPFEKHVGGTVLLAFEFTPGGFLKDVTSLATGGVDLISGEKLASWQKGLIILPVAAKSAKAVIKIAKGGLKALKASKYGKNIVNLVEEGNMLNRMEQKFVTGMGDEIGEVTSDTLKTFEQARNEALDLMGDLGSPVERRVVYGKLGKQKGKIVGFRTKVGDTFKRFRIDWDPSGGAHINVEIGKGSLRVKHHIYFKGTEEEVLKFMENITK